MRTFFALVSAGLLLVAGCAREANLTQPASGDSGKPPFVFSTGPADAYVVAGQTRVMKPDGSYSEYQQQWTYFYTTTGSASAANAVKLNGQSLNVTVGSQAGSISVDYDGAQQVWDVTGNANVPTFRDSITSPSRFSITEPDTKTDTVMKSSGFTLEYNSPGTDSVYIVLEYSLIFSRRIDTTASTASWRKVLPSSNTGAYTVSSSHLAGMPTKGWMTITVVAPKFLHRTVSGRDCALVSTVSTIVAVPFK